jgi:hypothetical protein
MFAPFCQHCRHWADGRATEENVGTPHAIGAIPSWEEATNIKPMSPALLGSGAMAIVPPTMAPHDRPVICCCEIASSIETQKSAAPVIRIFADRAD